MRTASQRESRVPSTPGASPYDTRASRHSGAFGLSVGTYVAKNRDFEKSYSMYQFEIYRLFCMRYIDGGAE